MRVIMATNNAGKLAELRELLPRDIELVSLREAGLNAPDESGLSFEENALIKARHASRFADAAIADDSGLEVDALGGKPGIRSARYAGPSASDADNNQKLLRHLSGVPRERRQARFVSVVALVTRDGREYVASGFVDGVIVDEPRGGGGFGYDPLFEIHDAAAQEVNGRTMAELDVATKNRISHRARAYRALSRRARAEGFSLGTTGGSIEEDPIT